MRVGLTISLVAHSAALAAVVLCFPLHRSSSPQVIPVSVATIDEAQSSHPELGLGRGSVSLESETTLSSSHAEAAQKPVITKLTRYIAQGKSIKPVTSASLARG